MEAITLRSANVKKAMPNKSGIVIAKIFERAQAVMQISNESVELEELREMKADVERREKAQAAVLERQAKRLEELETLYKVCFTATTSDIRSCYEVTSLIAHFFTDSFACICSAACMLLAFAASTPKSQTFSNDSSATTHVIFYHEASQAVVLMLASRCLPLSC